MARTRSHREPLCNLNDWQVHVPIIVLVLMELLEPNSNTK